MLQLTCRRVLVFSIVSLLSLAPMSFGQSADTMTSDLKQKKLQEKPILLGPPPAACGAGAGDCAIANGTPGCDDLMCCELICGMDAFCCDTTWDDVCAAAAIAECGVVVPPPADCGAGAGGCFTNNGTPGCDDVTCCDLICTADEFCCSTGWDQICADSALANCDMGDVPGGCCLPDMSCTDVTDDSECDILGGVFQGDNSICVPNICFIATANDECDSRVSVPLGTTNFDLVDATSSGPEEAGCAFPFGNNDINQDLWFNYTAEASGTLFVDTCGALELDTRLAIYEGCECAPLGTLLECNDD
ncbi:MAG: hypothetical protein AAF432_11000, partial [Planctomycetota bacterium]